MPLGRPLAARSPGDPPTRGIGDGCTRLHESNGLAGGWGEPARTPPSLWGGEAPPSHFSGSQALPRRGKPPFWGRGPVDGGLRWCSAPGDPPTRGVGGGCTRHGFGRGERGSVRWGACGLGGGLGVGDCCWSNGFCANGAWSSRLFLLFWLLVNSVPKYGERCDSDYRSPAGARARRARFLDFQVSCF